MLRRTGLALLSTLSSSMALTVGETAPAFRCKAHTGETVALADYAGKNVLLWFYPRASQFESRNTQIIGCSNDDVEKNAAFAAEQGFGYPLLCDTDLSVSIAYGAATDAGAGKASRIAALIDADGKVKELWDPAGKGEFPAQVLEKL